jgi:glutamate carboxypeptidase
MDTPAQTELACSVRTYLEDHQDQMLAVLEALVRAESPTDVPDVKAEVQEMLSRLLRTLDYRVLHVPAEETGGHLYARPVERTHGQPVQLLVGHCDTVWPLGTLQDMPFEVEDNIVRGPGVFDMKGGLTQMIFALSALRSVGADLEVAPVVFINSDEEQGSPTSRRLLQRLARCANRAFVLEPGLGLDGKLKTTRKGGGRFIIQIQGESAHAGLDPESGSSAILALSRLVQRLHDLNDPDAGISVNVGTIGGGTQPNVVADASRAEVDIRVVTSEQADEVEQAIYNLSPTMPGISFTVEGSFGRMPMEPTPASRRLWEWAQRAAELLDVALEEGQSGGVSDANTISQHTPTLDGLGAVGDGAHAEHEFCYLDKMVERSALLALLLVQPPLSDDHSLAESGDTTEKPERSPSPAGP